MTTSSRSLDTVPGERPVVATACGKVILLGEHSVVYGEPAIALPLSGLRLSVVLGEPPGAWSPPEPSDGDPDGEPTLRLPPVEVRPAGSPPAPPQKPLTIDLSPDAPDRAEADIVRALGAVARELALPVPLPLRVAVRTGGLMSGMGTSAALGVALARALTLWHGEHPEGPRILAAAAAVEQLMHRDPSGIDHTVSVLERPVWFEKGRPPEPLEQLPPLDLVLRPRRSARPTSEVVGGVRDRLIADPSLVRVVAEMGRWTREGRESWAAGDRAALAEAMTAQQRGLDRLGVVVDEDRRGIEQALAAGALAAKITGAGWGGTLIALAEEPSVDAILSAWGPGALHLRVAPRP